MMTAISFMPEFLDPLLRGDKSQTTRPQTDRFKVGDIAQIYNQQRVLIKLKPLRRMTEIGQIVMARRILNIPTYPRSGHSLYYAHFLGKVVITEVYDVLPINSCGKDAWAKDDGFADFTEADKWFESRYGADWMARHWTVLKWDGWMERYFEPKQP